MEHETYDISKIIDATVTTVKNVNETFQTVLQSNELLLKLSDASIETSGEQIRNIDDLQHVTNGLNSVVEKLNQLVLYEEFTDLQ